MTDAVLALNAGSSSIKFALYEVGGACDLKGIATGEIETRDSGPHLVAHDAYGVTVGERRWAAGLDDQALLTGLLEWIDTHLGPDTLIAVGHRVVHGGRAFVGPARLDRTVLQALEALTPLAPLHQPHSLAPVHTIMRLRPDLMQVACFDTAFHHTMPQVATRYALPRAYEAEGVRRYGVHGLSYEYIARTLRETVPGLAAGNIIVAHLGNGASLCAMQDGRSVDTTMGFTALDGLMMGTRCGAIDPGVLLYMLKEKRLDADALEEILYKRSGLLGVSGISSDMRVLHDSRDGHAREAIELFVYRITREAGALAASLGGLDGFVFTGGIGEHAADIRTAVCKRLAWLGVDIDDDANGTHAAQISRTGSRVAVRVIPTDEEITIARHTLETLRGAGLLKSQTRDAS